MTVLIVGGGIAGPVALWRCARPVSPLWCSRRTRPARLVAASSGVVARISDGSTAAGSLLIDPDAPLPQHNGNTTLCGYTRGLLQTRVLRLHDRSRRADAVVHQRARPRAVETDEWKSRALSLFTRDRTPVAQIVQTSDEIVGSNAYDILSTPVWHTDRMVIIGDAAHVAAPNAGQGASMAIEDAGRTRPCLRDAPSPLAAFQAYERIRRGGVERVVETSARMGSTAVPVRCGG